jgi:hypothetical protein
VNFAAAQAGDQHDMAVGGVDRRTVGISASAAPGRSICNRARSCFAQVFPQI